MIIIVTVEITVNAREKFATSSSKTCLALLRENTRPAHQALETKLNSVLGNISPSGYQTLLIGFYGFYSPIEAKLTLLAGHPVLEGAALGGQVIAPPLKVRLGITPQNGSAFFYGEGPRVYERWKAFLQILAGFRQITRLPLRKRPWRLFKLLMTGFFRMAWCKRSEAP
jgi:heme oxygenase